MELPASLQNVPVESCPFLSKICLATQDPGRPSKPHSLFRKMVSARTHCEQVDSQPSRRLGKQAYLLQPKRLRQLPRLLAQPIFTLWRLPCKYSIFLAPPPTQHEPQNWMQVMTEVWARTTVNGQFGMHHPQYVLSLLATPPPLQEADVQENCFAISTLSFVLPLKVRLNIRLHQATLVFV